MNCALTMPFDGGLHWGPHYYCFIPLRGTGSVVREINVGVIQRGWKLKKLSSPDFGIPWIYICTGSHVP